MSITLKDQKPWLHTSIENLNLSWNLQFLLKAKDAQDLFRSVFLRLLVANPSFFALFWLNLELYRIQNLAWKGQLLDWPSQGFGSGFRGFLPFCTVRTGSPASWLVTLRILKLQMHWHHPLLQRNRETHENNCNCSTEIKCHSCK